MASRKAIMSNQTRGFRQVDQRQITQDAQQFAIDLPRGPHIEAAIVRIGGTMNISTTYTAARSLAPYQFLRRADWVLNSNVTLDSVSGPQLFQLYVTRRAYPTSTTPAFGVGATTFEATYILDRALMDMMRPKDSMLKTDVGVSNNQLRLQLGLLADMFTGAGVSTYTNVTCTTSVIDYQEARDQSGNTPSPLFYPKRNGQRVALSAAGTGQQIKLNTGNRLRIVSLRVLNATTGEPDATLLTRIRIVRAGDTRVDMPVTDLARMNTAAYGVALAAGQVVVDFANTGQLGVRYSEYWPIPSSADTYLLVDTTAACILDIATLEGVDLVSA